MVNKTYSYSERLRYLGLPSLELRRLHLDLIFCYKIVFGIVNVSFSSSFKFSTVTSTRGHQYKLYKSHCSHSTRSRFFALVTVLNLKELEKLSFTIPKTIL